jgi:ankyrin repeat protein
LIESGAHPFKYEENTGSTALHFAAGNNDIYMIDYLLKLDKHITVDIQSLQGFTPAGFSCLEGRLDSLNLLLEYGADMKIKNSRGESCYDVIL